MKTNNYIAERNRVVEEHLWCIEAVMASNPKAVHRTRMEREDVYQQLALRLVQAVDRFDPSKAELKTYLFSELKMELLSCGMTHGRPAILELDLGNIIPFETVRRNCLGIA